jgi:DsbC/DsbD-like thiol-disulfide interchange protein/cytochrome c biogenesis protein CcdA
MRAILAALVVLLVQVTGFSPTHAEPGWTSREPLSEARLISDMEAVTPGQDFYVGLHLVLPEGWHTYWRNPGDAGLPAMIDWTLPEGLSAGDIIWPAPHALPLGPIMDYGYEDEVVLPVPFQLGASYVGTELSIRAAASWLVCEEICIPEEGEIELVIQVADEPREHSDNVWFIREALAAEPQRDTAIEAILATDSERLVLTLTGGVFSDPLTEWRNVTFFPFDQGLIKHAAEQSIDRAGEAVRLLMSPGYLLEHGVSTRHGGVLNYERLDAGIWSPVSVEIQADPGISVRRPMAEGGAVQPIALIVLLVMAFGGGLILNLMPCVFPVLSIKALKIVETAHAHPRRVRRYGLYFLLGVVLSFVSLAALLVILLKAGLPIGWGFQLQVPVVVAILSVLFFAIGLNLLGVFQIGTSVQGVGSRLADQSGGRGSFFTGVLVVVVAAPCVGPLAAGALGAALTQPAPVLLLVAASMGLGLGSPFLLLSLFPSLLRFVPKPGPWMDTFKQALAFPMFASALWLIWVLSIQSGPQAVLLIGLAFLTFALGVWAHRLSGLISKGVTAFAFAIMIVSVVGIARLPSTSSTQTLMSGQEAWSRDRVAELRQAGHPVFIDVTAAWCVTCQLNKLTVLDDHAVRAAFEDYGVAQLRADWTNRDDEIAALIHEHGGAGVPLYLLYPADGGPALVLPTILTRDTIIDALEASMDRSW